MNRTLLNILVGHLLLVLASCETTKQQVVPVLRAGTYDVRFDVGETEIPVRMRITENGMWCFHNWDETIILDSLYVVRDSFYVKMPLFNTALSGKILSDSTFAGSWTDYSREKNYSIPFSATLRALNIASCDPELAEKFNKTTYEVVFSPESPTDSTKAVGVFYSTDHSLVGTFLTESGDYRFLEGNNTGSSLMLSAFDGAHLFYFCANIDGDNLTDGKFYSGNHWQEEWVGKVNTVARLRDPDSLTFVKDTEVPFRFHVRDMNGDSVLFDSSAFNHKVTIVQIFGSWCPNCTDESRFMKTLYDKYAASGLQILPVAFERSADFEVAKSGVLRQFGELGLEYSPYIGGQADKGQASKVFASLSKITSYPTALFIDKTGHVRKIHTGFYGPGTGEHFEKHTTELTGFVESLLAE